jgi:predicted RNase H-like HicB family nuclease
MDNLTRTKYLPEQSINRYLDVATSRAIVKKLEDGTFFVEIPGFDGVWASSANLEECARELRDVLFDWLVLKIEQNDRDIPVIDGVPNLNLL